MVIDKIQKNDGNQYKNHLKHWYIFFYYYYCLSCCGVWLCFIILFEFLWCVVVFYSVVWVVVVFGCVWLYCLACCCGLMVFDSIVWVFVVFGCVLKHNRNSSIYKYKSIKLFLKVLAEPGTMPDVPEIMHWAFWSLWFGSLRRFCKFVQNLSWNHQKLIISLILELWEC